MTAVLQVFLDCTDGGCHAEYLREELTFADYVRDRADADVHVLVTRAETGAGGPVVVAAPKRLARRSISAFRQLQSDFETRVELGVE